MKSFLNRYKKAAVFGAGRSGKAALRLLSNFDLPVCLLEKNPGNIPEDFKAWLAENKISVFAGEHRIEYLDGVDLIIPSPGVARAEIVRLYSEAGTPCTAEIMAESELAWRFLEDEPVIGITGTSGKTTTTSLCSAMLQKHGLNVFTGGNIGVPLSEYVLKRLSGCAKADAVVLELSSFQLQTCSTLRPRVGVLLNISENHLDFHKDMDEYIDAKMQLFAHQEPDDFAILNPSLGYLAEKYRMKAAVRYFSENQTIFPDTKLIGMHNQSNASAAFLAASVFNVTKEEAEAAMKEFSPIANRLENVAEINGVLYVNDSKCTTVEALKVALNSFEKPVLLLAGGKFKGGDLQSLRPLITKHVKSVFLFGASRSLFEGAWSDIVPVTWDEDLNAAFSRLHEYAEPGDIVLLAPATASFDQYANYAERGSHFRQLVLQRKKSTDAE